MDKFKIRRISGFLIIIIFFVFIILSKTPISFDFEGQTTKKSSNSSSVLALNILAKLPVKKTDSSDGYSRDQFGGDWAVTKGCDTRNIILYRDLKNTKINDECQVLSGKLSDPYTGKIIQFKRGSDTSSAVQIDHVVALSDAWKTGAQELGADEREELANDPLELLAVDGQANQDKSGADASGWLPSNVSFRCEYIARQIAVKYKYHLWVTLAEHNAMEQILQKCDNQMLPSP